MNKRETKGWLKHWDFILLDIICLQICFVLSYWLVRGMGNPYQLKSFRYQAELLAASQLFVIAFFGNYTGILRRKKFDEFMACVKNMLEILFVAVLYMFLTHDSEIASRLQIGFTAVFYVFLDFLLHHMNKHRIMRANTDRRGKRSLVLFTSLRLVDTALKKLYKTHEYQDYRVSRIVLLDAEIPSDLPDYGIPISGLNDEIIQTISHEWVDEAFILQPDDMVFPTELMDDLMLMGITVDYTMSAIFNDKWPQTDIRKLGDYKVLTNSIKFASAGELAVKRAADILGGLVGCVLTGILFLFIAPAIYRADPGPIIFTQERIGQNGKKFKMHKFRSMYMDAEARKTELMSQNRIKDGMMFKMEDDPRIIGSEKKDKNGKPKGIGNFIRNTSLDEFPQFFDVLVGNLSLVGWRPCTIEEWEKYNLKHRIRASMKPGITGMWQVSGRSEITDFEEVVRLDREYIEKWNLLLDLRILLKTVVVVLAGRGAE